MSNRSKCYNSLPVQKDCYDNSTVEDEKALHSSESSSDSRYWAYRSSIFPRIAPPALMGDYRESWNTFIQEMQAVKGGEILPTRRNGNICIFSLLLLLQFST